MIHFETCPDWDRELSASASAGAGTCTCLCALAWQRGSVLIFGFFLYCESEYISFYKIQIASAGYSRVEVSLGSDGV